MLLKSCVNYHTTTMYDDKKFSVIRMLKMSQICESINMFSVNNSRWICWWMWVIIIIQFIKIICWICITTVTSTCQKCCLLCTLLLFHATILKPDFYLKYMKINNLNKLNIICTCVSFNANWFAISIRRDRDKYFCVWNSFSNSVNCFVLKLVRFADGSSNKIEIGFGRFTKIKSFVILYQMEMFHTPVKQCRGLLL